MSEDSSIPTQTIESSKEFKDTPTGWYKRWSSEMVAANKRVKRWHKQGFKIQSRYQDKRGISDRNHGEDDREMEFRVNLFHANVKTLREMIYGNPPKVSVDRRYADPEDDTARVASMILDRMLNASVEASGDDTNSVLGYALDDRLLPGFGIARVRYEYDSEIEEIEALLDEEGNVLEEGYEEEMILDEKAPVEYVHWDDFRWGWARTWSEVPWIAFRAFLTKDQATKRFGKEKADQLQYKNKSITSVSEKNLSSDEVTDAWDRAEIWEIWDKKTKCVYWWCAGFERILDKKSDPLKLFGFWPCPEPMLANCTTALLLPQPDFALAQDLYNQIDQLESRIAIITTAVRVVGVYDSASDGVKRMLQEGMENELIPVENWGHFAEGKGLDGKVQWMPIAEIADVLDKLTKQRSDAMSLLYEVTGMAEIMRGGNGPDRETAEAASGKRQFASVRVQGLSEDFARFSSDLMAIRAEIIGKHFSKETIVRQSNVLATYDRDLAGQAVELIKDYQDAVWRVKITPESLAMLDYQQLKKDRIEFIGALAQFMQSAFPLAEMDPNAVPPLLQILKWTISGFKGSNEIEGVLDKALDQMLKAGPQKKNEEPSPEEIKAKAQAQKAEQDKELQNMKHQHAMQLEMSKFSNALKELQQEMTKEIRVIREEMGAAIKEEAAQSEAAMIQDDHETENQIRVDNSKVRNSNGGSGEG